MVWHTVCPSLTYRGTDGVEAYCILLGFAATVDGAEKVVVIGLDTFSLVGSQPTTILSGSCRLVVEGEVWGRPALGIAHLSSARLRTQDWTALVTHFREHR